MIGDVGVDVNKLLLFNGDEEGNILTYLNA
jgi:hypothetical protein